MVASDKKNRTRKIFEFAIAVMVGLRIKKNIEKYQDLPLKVAEKLKC